MLRRIVLPAGLAVMLSFTASAASADGRRGPVYKDAERLRVETLDREAGLARRAPVRLHYRYSYRPARHVRRHHFVTGVYTDGFPPVSYAVVTHRTYIYYTPYPSVAVGYPPYTYGWPVYGLAHGPVYNKPCLC